MFKYSCTPLILLALFVRSAIGGLQVLETTPSSNGLDCDKFLHINDSSLCPPWTYFDQNMSRCECGSNIHHVIRCTTAKCTSSMATPIKVWLAECYCMSYNDKLDMEVIGACPYLCTSQPSHIPHNRTELNKRCNFLVQQNRTGELCGCCFDGYAPSAYSSGLQCANCSNYQRNWIKYIAIAYLPLILLYVVVLLLRINALSGRMTVSIFIFQMISCAPIATPSSIYFNSKVSQNGPLLGKLFYNHYELIQGCVKLAYVFYGVWNLDFYRFSFEPLCLYPNMSTLQVLSLDYLIALFPILMIAITFLIVKLYNRFKLVQYFCRPIVRLTALLSKLKRDLSVSLIETFGTFILLSYVKVLNSSLSILMPVHVKNMTGYIVSINVYYNGSLEYFGSDHRPYAVLAIFMLTTFNLMPLLLLCLYPCRCFQSCLNCCRLNSQVLRTFMDAFQGCYKFEPYDCRYFSSLYLFLRIIILFVWYFTLSGRYFWIITGLLLLPVVLLLSIIRPYRERFINAVDIGLLLTLALSCFSTAMCILSLGNHTYLSVSIALITLTFATPLIYMLVLIAYPLLLKPCLSFVRNCHQRHTSSGVHRSHFLTDTTEDRPLLRGIDNLDDNEFSIAPQ